MEEKPFFSRIWRTSALMKSSKLLRFSHLNIDKCPIDDDCHAGRTELWVYPAR